MVDAFAKRLRGALLRPGDDGYDEARKVWNAMTDRRPGVIVQCAGTADVMAAVTLARDHGDERLRWRSQGDTAPGHFGVRS
jgi:hypothetical protein